MTTAQKCSDVMKAKGWKQRELAEALGVTETNMIHIMKGRRPMPVYAMAKLERLRGTDDRSIVDMIIRTGANVALVAVLLFWTGERNEAYASSTYMTSVDRNTNYRAFIRRTGRAIRSAAKVLSRTFGRRRMLVMA